MSSFDLEAIRDMARLKPDTPASEIGKLTVADASLPELRAFAAQYIADFVESLRRADARAIESAATRPLDPDPTRQPHPDCVRWLADPATHWHISNSRDRARFKAWAGDQFNDWFQQARAAAESATATRPNALHLFEGDWHPDGPAAYDRQLRQERLTAALTAAAEQFAAEIRLETTQELLDSVFALGDGRRVTWGDATVADHRDRIRLLMRNAHGVIETAARHHVAIRMIERAGVTRLADLAVPA